MLIQFEKLASILGGFHMLLRASVLLFAGLLGCAALNAQQGEGGIPLPPAPCTVSVATATLTCPQGFDLYYDLGQIYEPLAAAFAQLGGEDGAFFTYNFAITGGNPPPGLSLSPSGVFSGALTTAGQFDFVFTISISFGAEGVTIENVSHANPAVLIVTPTTGPPASINRASMNFSLTQNGAAVTQSATVSNYGSSPLEFTASASTTSGGNWLALSSSSGSIPSAGLSSLSVTADPSQLAPGTYSGTVTVSITGGQTFVISVVAVVTGTQPIMELTQSGLTFNAVVGGSATGPQSITVLNSGAGTVNFSASASTISGGSWLNVSPSSGSSSASSSGSVTVSVNPAGLQPGTYYGKISFSSTNATNSPQIASVVLNVVSPANSPGASVAPTGLIFVADQGGTNPAAQTVSITNPSPNALAFAVTAFSNNAATWLAATPSTGSVSATQPATLSVQPTLQGLQPGVYLGSLTVTIVPAMATGAAGAVQSFQIEVLLIVLPSGTISADKPALQPRASTCTPSQLLPVFTLLGTGFSVNAGWPTAIEVTVVDDCGNPLTTGSVTATFSTGDPALSLASLGGGRWTSTWNASKASPTVTITAQAQEITPALTGKAQIGGALQPNAVPSVNSGGVVSAISFVNNQPLAPGAYAAIFGANLSQKLAGSSTFPLDNELASTSVFLNGEQLPLLFASGGQVNAVVPYDVPVNSSQQLLVQQGTAISIPQSVVIAAAQPAIVTQNGTGSGPALYGAYNSSGQGLAANSPVGAGYLVVFYCSGLGAVNPSVAAGAQTPLSPLSKTVNPVTVNFGSTQVSAEFAGLAPGFAQLYQVNAVIPKGLPSGNATVTLSVAGQTSAPVTITIQ